MRNQNLEKPLKGRDGNVWHFRIWYDVVDGVFTERVYFWDESNQNTGCAEFSADQSLNITKLKQRMRKIMLNQAYREQFRRELQFPIERYYS